MSTATATTATATTDETVVNVLPNVVEGEATAKHFRNPITFRVMHYNMTVEKWAPVWNADKVREFSGVFNSYLSLRYALSATDADIALIKECITNVSMELDGLPFDNMDNHNIAKEFMFQLERHQVSLAHRSRKSRKIFMELMDIVATMWGYFDGKYNFESPTSK